MIQAPDIVPSKCKKSPANCRIKFVGVSGGSWHLLGTISGACIIGMLSLDETSSSIHAIVVELAEGSRLPRIGCRLAGSAKNASQSNINYKNYESSIYQK